MSDHSARVGGPGSYLQWHTNSNAQVMISKFNCCCYSSGPIGVFVELFKQLAQASYTTNQAIIIHVLYTGTHTNAS